MTEKLLAAVRDGRPLSYKQQIRLVWNLSAPAILAQLSSILMQYIDASMVGRLGANDSASIGLVSTTTWLIGGLCASVGTGFTVQIAHRIGAKEDAKARSVVKHGLCGVLLFSMFFAVLGVIIHNRLPVWMGGAPEICGNASKYFLVYAFSLPALQVVYTAGGMIQCSGNMKLPSIVDIMMCVMDVIFNALLIFPTRKVSIGSVTFTMPGAGLGVVGAALGTTLAEVLAGGIMLYYLLVLSPSLHLRMDGYRGNVREELTKAVRIALPASVESVIMGLSYVAFTKIVSPLGTVALAAHSFSITAESLCYMPGYGIGHAATTIVGQSLGAGRKDITKKLSYLTVGLGVGIMTLMGVLLYVFAPEMIGLLSPDEDIRTLGTAVLRIEAFAEPMYAASIVAAGVFRGAGKTLTSSVLNLVSVWFVRIPLAAFLAPLLGLTGVWTAMCAELIVRGLLFVIWIIRWKV